MEDNWIKCSDRLPEEIEEVLFYRTDCHSMEIGFIHHGEPEHIWGVSADAFRIAAKDVSHWQLLPPNPQPL